MAQTSTTQATTQSATQTATSGYWAEQTKSSKSQVTASAQSNSNPHWFHTQPSPKQQSWAKKTPSKAKCQLPSSRYAAASNQAKNSEQNSSNTSAQPSDPSPRQTQSSSSTSCQRLEAAKSCDASSKQSLVGAPIGDVSTLEDDASVEDIKTPYEEMRKQLARSKPLLFPFCLFFCKSYFSVSFLEKYRYCFCNLSDKGTEPPPGLHLPALIAFTIASTLRSESTTV